MNTVTMITVIVLTVTTIAFGAAPREYSFQIVPGVSLGPVHLDMSFARALGAMPDRPIKVEQEETYEPGTGVVSTRAIVTWGRVKPQGEGFLNVFIAADFAGGRMRSVWGNDDRLAYRGKNIADLRVADLIAALGVPDRIQPLSYGMYSLLWKSKGVVVGIQNGDENQSESVFQVGVFRPGQFEDF